MNKMIRPGDFAILRIDDLVTDKPVSDGSRSSRRDEMFKEKAS
jgi:hypothetical protein